MNSRKKPGIARRDTDENLREGSRDSCEFVVKEKRETTNEHENHETTLIDLDDPKLQASTAAGGPDFPGGTHPYKSLLKTRSVYDLETTLNAYGRDIYVEEWEENTGRPKVWYEFNKQRILMKHERGPDGITISYLGKSPYID